MIVRAGRKGEETKRKALVLLAREHILIPGSFIKIQTNTNIYPVPPLKPSDWIKQVEPRSPQ